MNSPVNQKIGTKLLRKLGYSVASAWNGREALSYVAAAAEATEQQGTLAGGPIKPDIILMDLQMPVLDGYRCAHYLRHQKPFRAFLRDVPIIAMTASAIPGDRERCRRAGMDDCLCKPVQASVLEKALVRWRNARQQAAYTSFEGL
jgi:CheY-like chemotaxis protein